MLQNKYIGSHFKYNSMATTALVQARIEPAIKQKAENYFHSFGMDTATAIRIFFAKVAETGCIPFTIGVDAEDAYDAATGAKAYEEHLASGKKARPISELYKKYDI